MKRPLDYWQRRERRAEVSRRRKDENSHMLHGQHGQQAQAQAQLMGCQPVFPLANSTSSNKPVRGPSIGLGCVELMWTSAYSVRLRLGCPPSSFFVLCDDPLTSHISPKPPNFVICVSVPPASGDLPRGSTSAQRRWMLNGLAAHTHNSTQLPYRPRCADNLL